MLQCSKYKLDNFLLLKTNDIAILVIPYENSILYRPICGGCSCKCEPKILNICFKICELQKYFFFSFHKLQIVMFILEINEINVKLTLHAYKCLV